MSTHATIAQKISSAKSAVLRRYADWRVGATRDEKFVYRTSPNVLLTFDDYGSADQIKRILKALRAANVRAMFFLQGDWASEHPELVTRLESAGHIIGNHTTTHPNLLELTDEQVKQEILDGPDTEFVRPPMGRYNRRIRNIIHGLGKKIAYWSIDSDDWQGVSGEQIIAKVSNELHQGAVILMHIHADNTIAVLPELIKTIRDRGFELERSAN
jgi:peptidoglycan/xylan/chitin deacetylase (PgdA/CDA1 family)